MAGIKRILREKKGMTMVSVLAAFALLLVAVAMLAAAMRTAGNTLARAEQRDRRYEAALEAFYRVYAPEGASAEQKICLKNAQGDIFFLDGALKEAEIEEESLHFYYYQCPADPSWTAEER